MTEPLAIRVATPDDATGLQACMIAAYQPYQARMGEKPLPPMDLDYVEEIRNYPTWVIDDQGTIVGGITMMFETSHASIANIAVHPDYQGQGLGSRLLKFGTTQAVHNHYTEMRLVTHQLLTENINLYQHLGWVEVSRDNDRVYMKKDL